MAAAVAAVVALTGFGPPDPDGFTSAELARSVSPLDRRISDLNTRISDLSRNVQKVATERREGRDDLITLNSDILFGFDSTQLSDRAVSKIRSLAAQIPRRATVFVGGHTDSIGGTSYNQRLSTRRAQAVAAAIRAARPDLKLDVRGYGESRPVASNGSPGSDNPDGRAKNRRVELRYRR